MHHCAYHRTTPPTLFDPPSFAASQVAMMCGVDGLVVSNTTVERPPSLRSSHKAETGGLSGAPLNAKSTAVIAAAYRISGGQLPIIGA